MQIQYAALDAYCLLQLLDKWAAAAPPSQYPMYHDAVSQAKDEDDTNGDDLHSPAIAAPEQLPAYEVDSSNPEDFDSIDGLSQQLAQLRTGTALETSVLGLQEGHAATHASDACSGSQGERTASMQQPEGGLQQSPVQPELRSWPLSPAQLDEGGHAEPWPEQAARHWGCRLELLSR